MRHTPQEAWFPSSPLGFLLRQRRYIEGHAGKRPGTGATVSAPGDHSRRDGRQKPDLMQSCCRWCKGGALLLFQRGAEEDQPSRHRVASWFSTYCTAPTVKAQLWYDRARPGVDIAGIPKHNQSAEQPCWFSSSALQRFLQVRARRGLHARSCTRQGGAGTAHKRRRVPYVWLQDHILG